jgi:hypothetical protein
MGVSVGGRGNGQERSWPAASSGDRRNVARLGADVVVPLGPELADGLATELEILVSDPSVGSASGIVEAVAAGRRLEGWALWCQLSGIAALLRRWRAEPPAAEGADADANEATHANAHGRTDAAIADRAAAALDAATRRARFRAPRAVELVEDCVAAEVSLACGLSQTRAGDRVLAADVLLVHGRLPRTARLLRAGLLDWPKIQLLTHRLGLGTEPLLAAAVERVLIPEADLDAALPGIASMTLPALTTAIESTIAALDAEEAAARASEARRRRCVSTRTEPDGMALLEASTGAEHVTAMWNTLTAAARAAKKRGDERTLDQLRLDELVTRVTGAGPAAQHANADGNAGDDAGFKNPAPTSPPAGGLAVGLTMPLTTFLEIADDPGVLDGYGPVPGALARQIARDAARTAPRTTTWRCVIVDDEHTMVLGVGRPVSTPRHDPPPRLADLVVRAHPFCVFPGCRVPARRCDLDHRIPYDPGDPDRGPTCSCNLFPLCRTHHRLKTAGLFTAGLPASRGEPPQACSEQGNGGVGPGNHDEQPQARTEDGDGGVRPGTTSTWTTRAGLRYTATSPPPTPPPAPPDLRPLLDALREQRAAGDARVGWMNHALRAAYRRGRSDECAETLADLEEALAAEVRHHDYGEVLARADTDPESLPPRPEPDDVVPDLPRWMTSLPAPPLDEPDPEPDEDEAGVDQAGVDQAEAEVEQREGEVARAQ